MNTPICDFARSFAKSSPIRLHTPGHKGKSMLGFEYLDITETEGADDLYNADGIIRESELNASELFGSDTFYSCEGSSLCIRAMLYLAQIYARANGKPTVIAAGRNAHRSFLSGAALLGMDIEWIYPESRESYISCNISPSELDAFLETSNASAVYLTSPDYVGNVLDISALSKVCHKHGRLLLVDNAHGAYLKFLTPSQHPIDLGADLCCDSAHKTLPALTGAAYLHISKALTPMFSENAKKALAFFGSTSPSYLILQSLDAVNRYLFDGYTERLKDFIEVIKKCKSKLSENGYAFFGNEPLKLTLNAKKYGYTGKELADILLSNNIVCEFSDPDITVMMLTPEIGTEGAERLVNVLLSIPKKTEITKKPPCLNAAEKVLLVRTATLSPSERIPIKDSVGRVLATFNVSCPPAIPIIVCGERITENTVRLFEYYGVSSCEVIK